MLIFALEKQSKMKYFAPIILFAALLAVGSCAKTHTAATGDADAAAEVDSTERIMPSYAKGFEVKYLDGGVRLLDIHDPENVEKEQFFFALVPKGSDAKIPEGYTRVEIPIESAICMTSLQLSNFIKLGLTDKVVGITSTRHLKNAEMNRRLREGSTQKIGIEGNFDNEVIIAIDPDVILISPFKRGGYDAIRNVDIPLIPHLGYKELTPLGQAEWLKVVGLLTGNEALANETFAGIEERYNDLRAKAAAQEKRPTVFSGEMRSGNWYAVGGRSFLAELFRDAGADYFLKDNGESGGVTLDYETVYSTAADADYWRIVNSSDVPFSYSVLADLDNRYTDFRAWKDHGVIYCNMKDVPFYESMPVEPEVILADFIHVFHPELLPDYEPVYYRLLK